MTLNEAYKILRRFQDWRTNKDRRNSFEVGLNRGQLQTAIDAILKSRHLNTPMTNCVCCRHLDEFGPTCRAKQIGECHRFEPYQELRDDVDGIELTNGGNKE